MVGEEGAGSPPSEQVWTGGQTDTTENITFLQLHCREVKTKYNHVFFSVCSIVQNERKLYSARVILSVEAMTAAVQVWDRDKKMLTVAQTIGTNQIPLPTQVRTLTQIPLPTQVRTLTQIALPI